MSSRTIIPDPWPTKHGTGISTGFRLPDDEHNFFMRKVFGSGTGALAAVTKFFLHRLKAELSTLNPPITQWEPENDARIHELLKRLNFRDEPVVPVKRKPPAPRSPAVRRSDPSLAVPPSQPSREGHESPTAD